MVFLKNCFCILSKTMLCFLDIGVHFKQVPCCGLFPYVCHQTRKGLGRVVGCAIKGCLNCPFSAHNLTGPKFLHSIFFFLRSLVFLCCEFFLMLLLMFCLEVENACIRDL